MWGVLIAVVAVILLGWSASRTASQDDGYSAQPSTPQEGVKTATPKATETTKSTPTAPTKTRIWDGSRYITIITYTGSGFQPQVITVERGETVRFSNKSSGSMRIASNSLGGGRVYAGLNQEKTVGKNGVYELTFSETGIWGYRELNNANAAGIVNVK